MLLQLRRRNSKALERTAYMRTRASISLHYGERLEVCLRLPVSPSQDLNSLAENYFDAERQRSLKADEQAVIYSDVLDYIERENELAEGLDLERKLLRQLSRGKDPLAGVLKTRLLPYQAQGAIFAACRGRVALADDMGLGKRASARRG